MSPSDVAGGASKAAYRMHTAMRRAGIDSKMLVQIKLTDDPHVSGPSNRFGKGVGMIRPDLGQAAIALQRSSAKTMRSAAWFPSFRNRTIDRSDIDVVHLHSVAGEMLTIGEVGRIRKPLVWTLHDMWAFCGTEHYAPDDAGARWSQDGYTKFNRDADDRGLDVDRWTYRRKQKNWKQPARIICPSRWLTGCVRRSALMGNWPVTTIPNPLDTEVFKPLQKNAARRALNLPVDKKLILFGGDRGTKDPRKGFDLLQQTLNALAPQYKDDWQCVILGQSKPDNPRDLGLPASWFGRISDEWTMVTLYSAADVAVVPSRQDNLPQSGTEAQACGCPVVAFNTTGLRDIVIHMKTGYLARPYSTEDLAHGIVQMLQSEHTNACFSRAARERALSRWSPGVVVPQYLEVYTEVVEREQRGNRNP